MARGKVGARGLQQAFYRGEHRHVLDRTLDSASGRAPCGAEPVVVGALAFLGRLQEAETVFRDSGPGFSKSDAVEARFYLSVASCRQGGYARAIELAARNHWSARKLHAQPRALFFSYQGLAFLRFFQGRFEQALRHGRRAAEAALSARFLFGKAFATELVGHCEVQLGRVALGLSKLELAERYAQALGDGGLRQTFLIARAAYRAQHGLEPEAGYSELQALVKRAPGSFPHSQATLGLELARQELLRGRADEARALLDTVCPVIARAGHRRQAATLTLRYAELAWARGEVSQALHLARTGAATLDARVDRAVLLTLLGMEAKCLRSLGLADTSPETFRRLRELSRRTGTAIAARMLGRLEGGAEARVLSHSGAPDEDPLGRLLDLAAAKRRQAVPEIRSSGYLSLLSECLAVPRDELVIYVGSELDCVFSFERGNVYVGSAPMTSLLRAALRALAPGRELSKQLLVSRVWGYESYHPLRHDPIVYRLMVRLRKALGRASGWLECSERGYRLKPGVRVLAGDAVVHPLAGATAIVVSEAAKPVPAPPRPEGLNYRQLLILGALEKERFVDVRRCSRLLKTSAVTARRDLAELTRQGRLTRLGKGRATRYQL